MGHRRTYDRCAAGQVYCSVWLEWHVDCAAPGCGAHATPVGLGEAQDLRQAERRIAAGVTEFDGWKKRRGRWYCPEHAAD